MMFSSQRWFRRLLRVGIPLTAALVVLLALHGASALPGAVADAQACNPCVCPQDLRLNCLGVEFYGVYTRVSQPSGQCVIEGWRMNPAGEGERVWRVTQRTLDRFPQMPEQNTLIIQSEAVALYRLTTGEFQVNAGPAAENKMFVVRWSGCPAENVVEESWVAGS